MKKNLIASLISGILYASIMSVWFYFECGFKNVVFIFIACFVLWFVLFFAFIQFQSRKLNKIAKDIDGEVLYSGLANHFVNIESCGGHIFITKDKVVFKSHSFNIQNHVTEIWIKDISNLKTYNNLGIIPNGLEIVHNGQTDKFIVNDRKKIIEILNTYKS